MNESIPLFYDQIAPFYDDAMEKGFISRLIRRRFQEHIAEQFPAGSSVLDLGCGAGSDAIFLAAKGVQVHGIDISRGMVEVAREKAKDAGLAAVAHFSVGDASQLSGIEAGCYDGAYSNFNMLNHLSDVESFAKALSEKLRPGSPVVITMMNRLCLLEVVGYLARLRFLTAARKLCSRERTLDMGVQLFFPAAISRKLEPYFSLHAVEGFGLFVPPAQHYSGKYFHQLFETLAALERPLLRVFPFYNFCDHYILILKKNESLEISQKAPF